MNKNIFKYHLSKKDENTSKGLKNASFPMWLILSFFSMLFLSILLVNGCASIKQPEGGPRDTLAPKIVKELPKNFSTKFKSKEIIIQFDEYFKLQNQAKEFNISPELLHSPLLTVKKKNLVITFQDSLEMNTTYTLNFGEAIQDVNESNKLKNYSYVFATGDKLDSLSISGKIIDAETSKPLKEAVVFIVPEKRDTILGKKRPSIYTLTDTSGIYQLKNLRNNRYHIYAIDNKSNSKIYQKGTDKIGFIDSTLVLKNNVSNVDMKLFLESPDKFIVSSRQINADGTIGLIFNQKLKNISIKITDPAALETSKKLWLSKTNDTAKIWLANMDFDSVKMEIAQNNKVLQTLKLTKGKKERFKQEVIINDNVSLSSLAIGRYYNAVLNYPLENVDVSKIELLEDSVQRNDFRVEKDSSSFLSYTLKYPFKQKKEYIINYQDNAVTTMYGLKNKKISKAFKLASPDDFGTLTIKYSVLDSNKNYIVQLVDQQDYKVIKSDLITKSTTLNYLNFPAKKYLLRVIYDVNKNNEWDTGNVNEKLQPEKIWYAPKQMYLRANWETEEAVEIPK